MQKVIRDGKVAVLYSPGFGAGWYTWNTNYPQIVFHPKIVEMVEQNRQEEIDEDWMNDNIENCDKYIFCNGVGNLKIHWLPEGTRFSINEYDGNETIIIVDDLLFTA